MKQQQSKQRRAKRRKDDLRAEFATAFMALRADIGRLASMAGRIVALEDRVRELAGSPDPVAARLRAVETDVVALRDLVMESLSKLRADMIELNPGGRVAAQHQGGDQS